MVGRKRSSAKIVSLSKCGITITSPEGISLPRIFFILIFVIVVGAIIYINW